jgi:hypothetical protein
MVILLSSCSGLRAGTVKGLLVDKTGAPAGKMSLQLIEVTGQQGSDLTLQVSDFKTDTDAKGSFAFEKVTSGRYVILILNMSFPLGGQPPSMAEMIIRNPDGKMLVFDLPASKGIDLGKLTMTQDK